MKNVINTLLALTLATGFAACGVGVEHDDQYTAQQRSDAKALNTRFDRVRGTYEGTFSNPDAGIAAHPARLLLYVVNVREGTNPDGTVRVRPALYARFQLRDVVANTDYLSMQGDFDELGTISMTSLSSAAPGTGGGVTGGTGGAGGSAASSGDIATISISGQVANDQANISLLNTGGFWGTFNGRRTSQDAVAPSSSDALELRQRLLAVYKNIEGSYSATIDSGSSRAPVEMTISINETATGGTGVSIPYLVAQYRRLDFPSGIGERQLYVNYDQLSNRIAMSQVAGGTGQTGGGISAPPGSTYFAGSGTWINGLLDVTLRDKNGYAGELKAMRKPYRN